ncbi:uncharacterized protein LOC133287124 [Gastrolobium bilobum]|uniref:uncharacterized protein LOC133287124 n=1 Tax=Gastrolobium bilobum TaxID=150636 RepID=UPI002AAF66F8|nr:uncharacterized protein LOC133287124 [Gastrolobium bilobum]
MSFEDQGYGYNSEELKTRPTSGDGEVEREVFPKFNEEQAFGKYSLSLEWSLAAWSTLNWVSKTIGRQFVWVKNDKVRSRAKCSNADCEWMIYCSWSNKFNCFQVKTFNENHTCCRIFKNERATRDWVAVKLEKRLVTQPNMTRAEAYEHLKEEYKVHVHLKKLGKALHKAKRRIEGNEKEQYAKLRDYLAEQPWLHLPDAMGEDANKSFYVIAFAVVDSETKENWKWFLNLLQEDIGSHVVHGWNFISDQQKGLIPALQEVMPGAHHRFCVQHVWKNFIKQWKDKAIRGIVWEAARCTTVPQFQRTMQKLKELNEDAWAYLHKIDPSCWVKAYFSHWPKCDNITNNMAEVWNAKIVGYSPSPLSAYVKNLDAIS